MTPPQTGAEAAEALLLPAHQEILVHGMHRIATRSSTGVLGLRGCCEGWVYLKRWGYWVIVVTPVTTIPHRESRRMLKNETSSQ